MYFTVNDPFSQLVDNRHRIFKDHFLMNIPSKCTCEEITTDVSKL